MSHFRAVPPARAFIIGVPQMAATAEAKVYPYPTAQNDCAAGQRPVTIDGGISCDKLNQHTSFADVMPAGYYDKRYLRRHLALKQCNTGEKGCS